jgi:small GTP-binding protein
MTFPVLKKDYDHLFKILIIGNSGVGKSNLLLRFSDGSFQDSFQPTIGVDFKIKSLTWDNKLIKLQLWDTAGQERFRTITSSYYKGAQAVLIVYDVTNRNSYNDVQLWIEDLEKHTGGKGNVAKIIVGRNIVNIVEIYKYKVNKRNVLSYKLKFSLIYFCIVKKGF